MYYFGIHISFVLCLIILSNWQGDVVETARVRFRRSVRYRPVYIAPRARILHNYGRFRGPRTFSPSLKTALIAGGALYIGTKLRPRFGHSGITYQAYSHYYPVHSVCYNIVFSGPNNEPITEFTDNEQLRTLDENDYTQIALVANSTSGNETPVPQKPQAQLSASTYKGLFLCPISPFEEHKTMCCGPSYGEYCCSPWERGNYTSVVVSVIVVVLVLLMAVLCCVFYMRRRSTQGGRILRVPTSDPHGNVTYSPAPGSYPTNQESKPWGGGGDVGGGWGNPNPPPQATYYQPQQQVGGGWGMPVPPPYTS